MQGQPIRPINEHYGIVEGQLLGKGSTGNVYLGRERNGSNRVAIKTIDLREVDNEVTRYLLSCEIAALSNLGKIPGTAHDNVIKLHDIVIQDHFIYLVMQLLEGGTLADFIRRHPNGLSQDDSLLIFRQILEGYRHIRTKRIIHRDLKPDNILFRTRPEAGLKVAIIDFGYCQMEEVPNKPQVFYNVGSPKYMAPEAYKQNQYSQKSDIWALGVIFYEMLVGKTCDQGMSMQTYLEMLQLNGVPFPQALPNFYRKIISSMLVYSHHVRYDCFQTWRELDSFQSSLSHQRSELLLPRESYNENDLRSTQQFYRNDRNKNSNIFRSMIVGQQPTAANSVLQMQPSQSNLSPNKQILSELKPDYGRFDEKFLKFGNRPPGVSIHQFQYPQMKQVVSMGPAISRPQNVDMQSVKQIIQRKLVNSDAFAMPVNNIAPQVHVQQSVFQSQHPPLPQPQLINPFLSYHSHPTHPTASNNPPPPALTSISFQPRQQTLQFRPDTSPRQKIHFNFMQNANQNTKPNQIIMEHNVPPGVFGHRRDQRFNTAPQQYSRNMQQHHDAMRMSIEKDVPPKQIYHSPERKLITLASKVQFFTDKKDTQMDIESPPKMEAQPQRPVSRPIINLRPSFNTSDARPSFVRLQPHFLRNPEGRTFASFRLQQ